MQVPFRKQRAMRLPWCIIWVALVLIIALQFDRLRGEKRMERLLNGDASVSIRELVISDPARTIHINDAVVLDEIARAMRLHSSPSHMGGNEHNAKFDFTGGGTFPTLIYAFPNGYSISLPSQALEAGFPTHDVFVDDSPRKVKELCEHLSSPSG